MGANLCGAGLSESTPAGVWLPLEDHPTQVKSVLSRKASIYFHHPLLAIDLEFLPTNLDTLHLAFS
jgi:hypothetical protein